MHPNSCCLCGCGVCVWVSCLRFSCSVIVHARVCTHVHTWTFVLCSSLSPCLSVLLCLPFSLCDDLCKSPNFSKSASLDFPLCLCVNVLVYVFLCVSLLPLSLPSTLPPFLDPFFNLPSFLCFSLNQIQMKIILLKIEKYPKVFPVRARILITIETELMGVPKKKIHFQNKTINIGTILLKVWYSQCSWNKTVRSTYPESLNHEVTDTCSLLGPFQQLLGLWVAPGVVKEDLLGRRRVTAAFKASRVDPTVPLSDWPQETTSPNTCSSTESKAQSSSWHHLGKDSNPTGSWLLLHPFLCWKQTQNENQSWRHLNPT